MPQPRNSIGLSIEQLQRILRNDRIRHHLIEAGYIDRRGYVIHQFVGNPRSRRPHTTNMRRINFTRHDTTIPSQRRPPVIMRPQSPDYNSNDHRRKSALTNQSKRTNKSLPSPRVQNVIRYRPVSPEILTPDERCLITLTYYGPELNVGYDRDLFEPEGDEILLMQQHCGGENFLVFKGFLKPGEMFSFQSRRHRDYPFALAFYWNGVIKDRLSICCESRCNGFMRITGKHGLIAITKVENAKACRRCRYEQRMKRLNDADPRASAAAADRRRRLLQRSSKTGTKNSKSPLTQKSKTERKGSDRSNSDTPVSHTKKPTGRTSSTDSNGPDASSSKLNGSRTKTTKTKTDSRSKSKTADSELSDSESPTTHNRPSKPDKVRSSSSKSKSTETKETHPSSSIEIESDISNTEPTEHHARSSELNRARILSSKPKSTETKKTRLPSPQQVDSDTSNSQPTVSQKKIPEISNVRSPSLNQVESIASSPEPHTYYSGFSKANEPHISSPEAQNESPPPARSSSFGTGNHKPQAANLSKSYDSDLNEPQSSVVNHQKSKESSADTSSYSSGINAKKKSQVSPVSTKRDIKDESTSSDDSNSDFRRYSAGANQQKRTDY